MPRADAASRLLLDVLRPERRRLGALAIVLLVAMLLPLAGPALIGRIIDDALAGEPLGNLTRLALAYLAVAAAAELLQLAVTWASVRIAWRTGNRLRERLADHALSLDMAWHGRHSPGELISRIDGDVEALTLVAANIVLQVIGNLVLVTGVVVVTMAIDWRVGVVIAASAVSAVVLMVAMRRSAVPANEEERAVSARLYGDLEERLGGLEDLRANGGGEHAIRRLHASSAHLWDATRRAFGRAQLAYAVAAATFAAGSVLTLGAGTILYRQGAMSLGVVLALFRYSQMIRTPLERIAEQLPELQRALAGTARAARLLAEQPAIRDPDPSAMRYLPAGPLAVDLDGVELAYDTDHPAVRAELHVPAGSTLGMVGASGSGKTSIGRLLLRFWDPTSGVVRLAGVDLRCVPAADLRQRVAVVTQDVELLRASVRENLTLLGAIEADDARLTAILEDIGLGHWLHALPHGLDTELHGASGLSAGEAQLLAFARAFLTDPGLVVLDEASSRLDPLAEALVTRATERLLAGRTAVVIAHRLATLDRVDEIAVIDRGRVVEHGARAVLAADGASHYARLVATAGTAGLLADEGRVA